MIYSGNAQFYSSSLASNTTIKRLSILFTLLLSVFSGKRANLGEWVSCGVILIGSFMVCKKDSELEIIGVVMGMIYVLSASSYNVFLSKANILKNIDFKDERVNKEEGGRMDKISYKKIEGSFSDKLDNGGKIVKISYENKSKNYSVNLNNSNSKSKNSKSSSSENIKTDNKNKKENNSDIKISSNKKIEKNNYSSISSKKSNSKNKNNKSSELSSISKLVIMYNIFYLSLIFNLFVLFLEYFFLSRKIIFSPSLSSFYLFLFLNTVLGLFCSVLNIYAVSVCSPVTIVVCGNLKNLGVVVWELWRYEEKRVGKDGMFYWGLGISWMGGLGYGISKWYGNSK